MNKNTILKAAKEFVFYTPFKKYLFPEFGYGFSASQICFLCACLEQTMSVEGNIAEIGCSDGSTTLFLNKFMDDLGMEKRYFAVDTFAGFIREDVDYEVSKRNKDAAHYSAFQVNKKKWFEWTMSRNNIKRVQAIEADVNIFDLKQLGPLSFVLLDLDLFRPMKKALNDLYPVLSPGGLIVVDDCDSGDERWDGSNQAYREFAAVNGLPVNIVHQKLGLIKKDI